MFVNVHSCRRKNVQPLCQNKYKSTSSIDKDHLKKNCIFFIVGQTPNCLHTFSLSFSSYFQHICTTTTTTINPRTHTHAHVCRDDMCIIRRAQFTRHHPLTTRARIVSPLPRSPTECAHWDAVVAQEIVAASAGITDGHRSDEPRRGVHAGLGASRRSAKAN